jgi:ABC-type bacteriocin/lantibiotic exporter with double-glycine peptidase domain
MSKKLKDQSDAMKPSPLSRFWRLLNPDKSEIRNVYVYAVFNGLLYLTLPLGVQAIINLIQGGSVNAAWLIMVSLVVGGIAVGGVIQIFQIKITEDLQQKIFVRAAFEFAYRTPRIKMEAFFKHYVPELMNRFFDVVSVQKGLSKLIIDFSSATLQVIFGLILLSLYHPFFILFSVVLCVILYAIFRLTLKKGLITSLEESKYKYEIAHWLQEVGRTHLTFKLSGQYELPMTRTNSLVGKYLHARQSHFRILVKQYTWMVAFKVIVAAGLLAIGGVLVMREQMNLGQFVAAEIIILLLMQAVEKLITSFDTVYDVLTALEKIGYVTDMEIEDEAEADHDEEERLPTNRGVALEFEQVKFTYPENDLPTLYDITFAVQAGDRWLLTGKNGSGKNTLLKLASGLYDLDQGGIFFDGKPKTDLNIAKMRARIGNCLHVEQIFRATMYENIGMGGAFASLDSMLAITHLVGLDEFIRSLEKGIHTEIDPQGKRLPTSVVIKIMLARCFIQNPDILLLEDVFIHLDDDCARKIIDYLFSDEKHWTILATSTHPYFNSKVHKVANLDAGRLTVVRQ